MDERKEPMMTRVLAHVRANVIAYLALFVALGGTGYAALRIPAGSVGTRQLKNHSITPIKFNDNRIAGYVRYWAQISAQGTVVASQPRARLVRWVSTPGPHMDGGLVSWSQVVPAGCFALATTNSLSSPAYASAAINPSSEKRFAGVYITLSAAEQAVDVAVICSQP